ncbi:MAG: S8 family serine peptidase, partial [Rhodoferax sp.]|nr:S8 family serine peptidase [Rhodoferax sp.]
MKFMRFSVLLVLALTLAASVSSAQAEELQARVIVRFKTMADSVRAKPMSARMDGVTARDIAQTRATALGLRTGLATPASLGLRAHQSLDSRTHVITAQGISSAELVRTLQADGQVELVVVDQRRRIAAVPNDPLFGGATSAAPVYIGQFPDSKGKLQDTYSRSVDQWYLKAPNGPVVSSINAPSAWDITTGAASVVVAVLDTGVRFDHPDLAGQFVLNTSSSTGKGGYDLIGFSNSSALAAANDLTLADDDPSDPGDWVTQADIDSGSLGSGCGATDIGNSTWHGTRVSGLVAAASNNGQGIAGVGWGIKLLPVRVLGKCGGYDSDIMAGMLWAAGIAVAGVPANPNPAKVLNMSLGGPSSCSVDPAVNTDVKSRQTAALYRDTINQVIAAGATIVAAAGNSQGEAIGLPGNCPGVIAVTALRHVGSKVGFSSVGPEASIAAPGGNCINLATGYPCLYPMVSTTNTGTTLPVVGSNAYTDTDASVGTSFSAPIVSGTVALMLSVRPSLTSAEVLTQLKRSAQQFITTGGTVGTSRCVAPTTTIQSECYCTTATCGAGMLDAGAAVAAAQAANIGEAVVIAATPAGARAGDTVILSVAGSTVGTGRTIASVVWSITSAGAGATFSAVASGTSTTVSTATAG